MTPRAKFSASKALRARFVEQVSRTPARRAAE